MVILQINCNDIGTVPSEGDAPIGGHSHRPAGFALQRVPIEARQIDLLGAGRGIEHRRIRPTLATFGTLNPLGSPVSKYRLSARFRKLRITAGKVMRLPTNVKCRFTWRDAP